MDNELVGRVVAEALKAVEARERSGQKIAVGTPVGPWTHGPGGLFSLVDGQHPILSAMIQPRGILSAIPARTVSPQYVTEFIHTMTGITASVGDEPEGVCDQPVRAGLKKLCTLVSPFGRQMISAREFDILRLGKRRDRFEDMSFTADFPINLMTGDNITLGIDAAGNSVSRSEIADRIFEMGDEFQKRLCRMVWSGTPGNNTGDGLNSGHMEFLGLDYWVNEDNKLDAYSSAVCRALNSDIKNFNYGKVDGTSPDLVDYITMMWEYLNHNARHMGLDPATWIIVMRPDLWHEVVKMWPCRYETNRCQNSAGNNVVVINDSYNQDMRNEMLRGMYLKIANNDIPVVTDMCMPELNWNTDSHLEEGEYASDIWFIPMTILGGRRATEFEIFNQDENVRLAATIARNARLWTTDGGRFLWTATEGGNGLCHDMQFVWEGRLNMYTTQLAGRIENIVYAPLQHLRSHDPSDTYFLDGGVTKRPVEWFYNQWGDYAPVPE